jgi:hypothetical protein
VTHFAAAWPAFASTAWQMRPGERAALEALLAQASPALVVEIGRAEGHGTLRLAAHAERVISIDDRGDALAVELPPNVEALVGDSHDLLPALLERLEREGRAVDFAVVDGDHSPDGVRRDLLDLVCSPAVRWASEASHHPPNAGVRRGIANAELHRHPKVAHVDADFVPGAVTTSPDEDPQVWGGVGVVVIDEDARAGPVDALAASTPPHVALQEALAACVEERDRSRWLHEAAAAEAARLAREVEPIVAERDRLAARVGQAEAHSADALARVARAQEALVQLMQSRSWRLTRPLRTAGRLLRRLR